MPYSVLTKDGIQINNIPDNIPSDSDEIRQRVEQARKNRPQTQQPTDQPKILKEGEGSDFLRGIGTYKDQFGGILGGAEVLAGKAVDSDEMIKSGLQRMDESEAAIGRRGVKVTDEFTKALDQGVGAVLTEFIPFIAGQGVGMIGEAFVTATAGAMVGSALAPGAGTVSGALTGLVSKNLVKNGIIDVAKNLGEKERNDFIKAETAKFLNTQAGKQAVKDIYKKAGSTAALGTMSAKFGAGETTGRAIDEAIKGIEDPQEQLEKIKELGTGRLAGLSTAHALANYLGLKIGLGALEKMAEPTKNVLLNIAKNIGITGLKEAPVEALQSGIERYAAYLPLSDKAAIEEYINAAAAGFVMPIVPATIGGLRSGPVSPKPNDPNPNIDVNEDIVTTDTINTENLTEEELKSKQKGWETTKAEEKRRKDEVKLQEEANKVYEDTKNIDVNNANEDKELSSKFINEQVDEANIELEEIKKQQELANVESQILEVEENARRENEVGNIIEDGAGASTRTSPFSSITFTDAQDPKGTFSTTVDAARTDTGRVDGRKGGLDSSLTAEQRQKLADDRAKANIKKEKFEQDNKEAEAKFKDLTEEEQIQKLVEKIKEYEINDTPDAFETNAENVIQNAQKQLIPVPERIQEFYRTYATIKQEGIQGPTRARQYLKNRLEDDNFKRELAAFQNITLTDSQKDTEAKPIVSTFQSNNKQSVLKYQKDNNQTDTHVIREDREIVAVKDGAEEGVKAYYLQPRVKLDLEKGNKLKGPNVITNQIVDYIIKDQETTIGNEYPIIQRKTNKKTGRKSTVINKPQIRKFLENTLDKEQYKELTKDKEQYDAIIKKVEPKLRETFLNKEVVKTSGKKTEQTEAKKRVINFNTSENPIAEQLKILALKLNVDIPAFMKTGAVFGSLQNPIEEATSLDDFMDAVLGDYIYEEAMDKILLKPDEGGKKKDKYPIGAFDNIEVTTENVNRRSKLRKEFYESPLFDDYLNRNNISKNKQSNDVFDNSVDAQVERFEKGQRKSFKYVDQKIASDKYLSGRDITKKNNDNYKAAVQQVALNKDQKVMNRLRNILNKSEADLSEVTDFLNIEENLSRSELVKETVEATTESKITRALRNATNAREALELLRNDILNSEASRLANYQLQLIDVLLNVPNLDNVKVDILTPLAMTNLAKKENISGVYTSNLNVNKQSTTISIVENLENSDTIKTFLHEAVHAATILKLGNLNLEEATVWRDILVKAREAAAQRGITKYEKQYYGLKDIKEFVAEAFTNEEFSNFLNTIDSINPQTETTFTSLFKDLVRAIKRLLNSDVDDTLLGDTIKFSTELFNVGAMPPASVRKINSIKATNSMENRIPREIIDILFPPETRTDPTALEGSGESKDKKERTSEQRRADMAEDNKQREKSAVRHTTSFIKNFFSNSQDYIDRVYKNFANAAGDLKKLQDYLESSNLLVRGVEGFNNIFDKLTLSHSIANDYMTDMLLPLQTYEQSLIDYVNFYVEQNPGKTDAQARAYIQDILLGQHEFERRQVRYILGVPLSTKKIMQGKNGKLVSPAEYRNEIMRTITNKEWTNPNERIAALKKYKQDLIFLTDPKTKISGEHTVNNTKIGKISEGESYSKPNSDISKIPLDITDSFYDTSVLTYKAGREVRQEFDSLKQTNPQLYNMIKKVRDNMTIVQNETLKTNAVGNYAGPQVLNIIDFYGWENYIPLKSKRDKSIVDDDIAMAMEPTGRMSRELKKLEPTFESQQEDAEDPFTQTVVDASLAASRAGRVQYTQAIFNAVTTKINYKDAAGNPQTTTAIDGKIEGIFSYEDRYNNTEELQKAIQKSSTVIHFLPNGSLAVISIKDPKLLLAIRQSYTDSNFIIDRLNYVTGKIGQMHTRYNFKFGPINFIRDVITNFWIIGTDLGLADVAGYAQAVSEIVGKGGLQKTFVMVRMYNKGEKTKLKKYVNEQTKKGNTYPKDFLEYLQRGGMVAYKQALSTESVFREQQQMVKGTRTAKTFREANNFFDAYMGMFELSSRVAAYQIFKKNYLARNATGLKDSQVPADVMEAAKESATVYAKRLSNFEEVGNFGRDLGAFYMFFRASAVGAARALQSVGPGFRSAKAVEADLPQYIKGNPEALASFRKSFARKQERARGMMGVGIGFGLTLFYMSALLATGDDEDDTNKTLNDDLSRWTRFARFDISGITGNKNDVLQLPWGFGLGGFPAIGAQLGGLLSSNENSYQSILGNTIEITLDSFAPFPISRMDPTEAGVTWFFDSFSPTLLRPLFEYSINSNAFGSPIYNASRARYGSAYQSGDSVPAIYRDLTIAMSEATNGAIDFSPNSVYFFMNNYIDAVSTLTQNLYSFQLSARGKQDFNLKSDTILLGSFFSKYSELDQRAYASTIRKIDKLQAKVNLFKDVNPAKYLEVLEENPMALGIIKSYESMKAQLNKLNEQANIIRKQPNLTPKQRKYFLDEIKTMQLILKRQITAAVEMELGD